MGVTTESNATERLVLQAVQWSTLTHIDDVDPINDSDYTVLKEVGEVLRKHGYQERFGVCLLHKHFEVGDGEIAMEETDEEARISTIRVVKDEEEGNSIGTLWRFGEDPNGPVLVTKCVLRCHYDSGHKQRHKIEGH